MSDIEEWTPPPQPRVTTKSLAKLLGISERSLYMSRRVIRSGRTDLVAAMQRGEMSIHRALCIVDGKEPTKAVDRWPAALRRAWDHCTPQQRDAFLREKLQICSHPEIGGEIE